MYVPAAAGALAVEPLTSMSVIAMNREPLRSIAGVAPASAHTLALLARMMRASLELSPPSDVVTTADTVA